MLRLKLNVLRFPKNGWWGPLGETVDTQFVFPGILLWHVGISQHDHPGLCFLVKRLVRETTKVPDALF